MITGKVARILNEFQLVLNVGVRQGVKPGMRFLIYEEGEEVRDPENGEALGKLELVKAEVEVVHVQETLCLVQAKEKKTESAPMVLSAKLAEVKPSARSGYERTHEKLYVRSGDIAGTASAGPITVGDRARTVE